MSPPPPEPGCHPRRTVVALGGNALLLRGEAPDPGVQIERIRRVAATLAAVASEAELVVCHGNGPQVGLLATETVLDRTLHEAYPLDVLVAETQGMIGYWLCRELRNAGAGRPPVALLTQTLVAPAGERSEPVKYVGPGYSADDVRRLTLERGWVFRRDGRCWRRVVPSPPPRGVLESDQIRTLLATGHTVVCGGGGGIPVARQDGLLVGVEGVVDKDMLAAELAVELSADRLVVLTDVDGVFTGFGGPDARLVERLDGAAAQALELPAGSMGPKVAACVRFRTATGRPAVIGNLAAARDVIAGRAGTTVV